MKARLIFTVLFSFFFYLLSSQVPQGFNYQAVARDVLGNPIINYSLPVKITIQSDSLGGTTFWIELHSSITTNSFGLFMLTIGKGLKQTGSTVATFNDIDWRVTPKFIKTEVNYNGWKNMGSTRIWSVPYSQVSGALSGSLNKLAVKGNVVSPDSALFEVKNNTGQIVFAVYNEGVRVYVDDGIAKKTTKGGFAIGGFNTAKGVSQDLLMISPDSVRIYVDETAVKGKTGGFAIGGFNTAKGTVKEFMLLTPFNYFIGHNSGQTITTGLYNSTLGYESGKSLIGGSNNIFVGYQSGFTTSGGGSNVFIGNQAGYLNANNSYNIALGRQAGYSTIAPSNIFVGDLTAYTNTTGYQNVMIGDWAGYHNTSGYRNIFLGAEAGWYNTTGTNNIFLGFEAGFNNTLGNDNIVIGNKADSSLKDGTYNVIIGTEAGHLNTSGDYNSLIGYKAGEKTTSDWNTMLGYLAGNANTTTGSQVLLGYQAGMSNTGGWNTMVGSLAGSSSGTGLYNTYVGLAAGEQATGSNNVFLGKWAGRFEYTNSNRLIIESIYSGTDYLNNALVYGDFNTRYLKVNGQIMSSISNNLGYAADFENKGGSKDNYGVNITSGTTDGSGTNYMIDFNNAGGVWKGSVVLTNNVVSLFQVSDARLKENISKSEINALKILDDLKVVDYNFTKSPDAKHTGYIAQDAQKVLPEMVIYNEKADAYAISTSTLIPVLHKAILEQQNQIELTKQENLQLKSELQLLKQKMEQIEAILAKGGLK
jgi:hypothetical protein